LIIRILI